MSKPRQWDDSCRASVAGYSISGHGDEQSSWLIGHVITPTHVVAVYTQDGHTRLDAVHRGRHIMRNIERRFTKLGLVRVAAKFARELATTAPANVDTLAIANLCHEIIDAGKRRETKGSGTLMCAEIARKILDLIRQG